ncbi:MAG: LrgB family protein [Alphaproteobacteria bacterium]|nr:LrgB family protein [Alphaproteobacteria bacterium]
MIWMAVTALLFVASDALYRAAGRRAYVHPVLLPVTVLVAAHQLGALDLAAYGSATEPFSVMLSVAVVGLAVPLVRNLGVMQQNRAAVLAAIAGGSITGVMTAIVPALLLGTPEGLLASLATKSITTPLAITTAEAIGGVPAIAVGIVLVTGFVVALVGPAVLRMLGVDDETAMGLAIGTAGHGIGTAEAVRLSDAMGGAAALAMTINGLTTALVLPLVWPLS